MLGRGCIRPRIGAADMWVMKYFLPRLLALLTVFVSLGHLRADEGIDWQPWSDGVFARAKAEKKLVLLDVVAGWCHWCHVMDEITYRDPAVVTLLREHYLAVRVDQDARPDIANRYEDYGWPATVVYDAAGKELAKRQGYLPPKPMAGMLQAFVDDPTPGPSVQPEAVIAPGSAGALTDAQRAAMRAAFLAAYDAKLGGWGDVHKYLNWDALEYCLTEGANGDARIRGMAQQTLTAGLRLIDPAWGGVYQYSTDGDWEHPHFEKIMPFQAENLRVFAMAATLLRDPQWLEPARKIHRYLEKFLMSPEGAFYVSQDADLVDGEHSAEYFALDDAGRRARGVPRVDQHLYARENGLAITGLAALYAASGDEACLAEARRAAEWVMAQRSLEGGGFRHDAQDAAGPYLADTLAMGRAFLALYSVTAEREWLTRAEAAEVIARRSGNLLVAVRQAFQGEFAGSALLIFPETNSLELVRAVTKGELSLEDIIELEQEALAEIGNIILNGCMATIANLLQRSLKMALPEIIRGKGLDFFESHTLGSDDGVLFIRINFSLRGHEVSGYVALVMDFLSLQALQALISDFIARSTG